MPVLGPASGTVAEADSTLAPAKVNLYLHVLSKRADGYHELQSLVAFADIGDRVSVTGLAEEWTLNLDGSFAEALGETAPADNLVLRAARRLAEQAPPSTAPLALRLTKSLPVAAGVGGGSADAAAAVRLLSQRWGIGYEPLAKWAELGADVPVCLANQASLVEGMGERVTAAPGLPPLPALLVNPGLPSATSAVFGALNERFGKPLAEPLPPPGCSAEALAEWLGHARNDLTRPAMEVQPAVGEVLAALAAAPGCRLSRMSGSGATCFGLFPDLSAADAAAAWLRARAPHWWIRPVTLCGGQPAG